MNKVIKSGMDSDTFKFKYHVRTYKATSNAVDFKIRICYDVDAGVHISSIEKCIHMVMQNVE